MHDRKSQVNRACAITEIQREVESHFVSSGVVKAYTPAMVKRDILFRIIFKSGQCIYEKKSRISFYNEAWQAWLAASLTETPLNYELSSIE